MLVFPSWHGASDVGRLTEPCVKIGFVFQGESG